MKFTLIILVCILISVPFFNKNRQIFGIHADTGISIGGLIGISINPATTSTSCPGPTDGGTKEDSSTGKCYSYDGLGLNMMGGQKTCGEVICPRLGVVSSTTSPSTSGSNGPYLGNTCFYQIPSTNQYEAGWGANGLYTSGQEKYIRASDGLPEGASPCAWNTFANPHHKAIALPPPNNFYLVFTCVGCQISTINNYVSVTLVKNGISYPVIIENGGNVFLQAWSGDTIDINMQLKPGAPGYIYLPTTHVTINSGKECGTELGGYPGGTEAGTTPCKAIYYFSTVTPTPTPTPYPNACSHTSCGNGYYCGGECGNTGTSDVLYNCQNNKTVGAIDCNPKSCIYNPSGPDYCGGPTVPPSQCQYSCVSSSSICTSNGGSVQSGFCAYSRTCCKF